MKVVYLRTAGVGIGFVEQAPPADRRSHAADFAAVLPSLADLWLGGG
jgi:hypothetical protein